MAPAAGAESSARRLCLPHAGIRQGVDPVTKGPADKQCPKAGPAPCRWWDQKLADRLIDNTGPTKVDSYYCVHCEKENDKTNFDRVSD